MKAKTNNVDPTSVALAAVGASLAYILGKKRGRRKLSKQLKKLNK